MCVCNNSTCEQRSYNLLNQVSHYNVAEDLQYSQQETQTWSSRSWWYNQDNNILIIHKQTQTHNYEMIELKWRGFYVWPLQIDKQQFEETIQTLNNLYAEAEKLGGKSYLEGCLACLTAYTIFLCMETHYEKVHFCCIIKRYKA